MGNSIIQGIAIRTELPLATLANTKGCSHDPQTDPRPRQYRNALPHLLLQRSGRLRGGRGGYPGSLRCQSPD